jgi:hypothetical protein
MRPCADARQTTGSCVPIRFDLTNHKLKGDHLPFVRQMYGALACQFSSNPAYGILLP